MAVDQDHRGLDAVPLKEPRQRRLGGGPGIHPDFFPARSPNSPGASTGSRTPPPSMNVPKEKSTVSRRVSVAVVAPHKRSIWPLVIASKRLAAVTGHIPVPVARTDVGGDGGRPP